MLLATATALTLALGSSFSPLVGVPLSWRPTDDAAAAANAASKAFKLSKLQVKPFVDRRQDKALIGENREDRDRRLPVTTRDDVGAFVSAGLTRVFKDAGVPVVSEGELVLAGEITRFMVDEDDIYRGTVTVSLTLTDARGRELWTGFVTGAAKRFGRSYQLENYLEVLSDAVVRIARQVCEDQRLVRAVENAGPLPAAEGGVDL